MADLPGKQLQGLKMMQKYFGEEQLNALRSKTRDDKPSKLGAEYIAEVCFSSYARPGLSFQDRALLNIGMLIALNRGPELRIHIHAALHNDLSEEKVLEACRYAMIYCGVPAGRDALGIAGEIFEERRQVKEAPRPKLT